MSKKNKAQKTDSAQSLSLSLSKEALIEIASFLTKAWSGEDVRFEITVTEVPYSMKFTDYARNTPVYTVKMPEITEFKVRDPLARYRVWRQALWHESMHIFEGFPDLSWVDNDLMKLVANAIEDYRIETLGVLTYPGMREETEFAHALAIHRADKTFEEFKAAAPRDKAHDEAVVGAFIYRTITGRIPRSMMSMLEKSEIDAVTKIADEARRDIMSGSLEKATRKAYEELIKLLSNPSFIPSEVTQGLSKSPFTTGTGTQGAKDIEEAVKEHTRELKLNADLSKPSEEVEREFKTLTEESRRREIEEKAGVETRGGMGKGERASDKGADSDVAIPIQIPRMLAIDDSPLYDHALIMRLKDQLRNIKRGFFEVYRGAGDEFDADEYARGGRKPFIDEERVRMGGLKVMIILDFSGSITSLEVKYKKAVVALAEALNFIKAKFAVYAFSEVRPLVTAVWQIKGFGEKWDRGKSRRLAQIYPKGGTPLDEVYMRLRSVIGAERPDVVITLTDGRPDDPEEAMKVISILKRETRMVAVAIGDDPEDASYTARLLNELGYHRSIAVSNLSELPRRILWLLSG